ncbi:MAG: GntR family transcriptional regulator [Anaerolineales bacterium]|nr:GntR family transcriptional regulator [Anaerolineales bacterium]
MEIEIEFQSGIPLYEQIAHQVLELIDSGTLSPGDQLPTTRELGVKLGINFNTVARAYRMLDQGEIISTQHGRGTFILEQRDRKNARKQKVENIEELTKFYIRKATYLGFEPEEIRTCFEEMVERKDTNKTKE